MSTRIIIDQNASNTAKMLAQTTNKILDAVADARRMQAILDSTVSGGTYSALATDLGGAVNATQAQDAWTIFSTARAAIDVSAVSELSRLDQG